MPIKLAQKPVHLPFFIHVSILAVVTTPTAAAPVRTPLKSADCLLDFFWWQSAHIQFIGFAAGPDLDTHKLLFVLWPFL